MSKTKSEATQTIRVRELTRSTASGVFTYAVFKGKCLRREHRRGRPSYQAAEIEIRDTDKVHTREISVASQLGRAFLGA